MPDMMTEMALRLRERRAKAEGLGSDEPDAKQADKKPPWDKTNGNGNKNGSESPKVGRRCEDNPTHKRFQSLTGQEMINLATTNGTAASGPNVNSADLEILKQEILTEVRKEINKAKQEIIDAIKMELNRR